MIVILLLELLLLLIINVDHVVDGARLSNSKTSSRTSSRTSSIVKKSSLPLVVNKLPDLSQRQFPNVPPSLVYDLLVVGSGVAGEAVAVRSAQLNKRVGIIERKALFGGPTGLTSKAVREACKRVGKQTCYPLHHHHHHHHHQYVKAAVVDATELVGSERRMKIRQLWKRLFPALKSEAEVLQVQETRDKLAANNIDIFVASAEFSNKENSLTPLQSQENSILRISRSNECMELEAKHVCIATGSRPNRPGSLRNGVTIPWTPGRVVCSTEIVNLPTLPNSIVIIGGGVIAVEYSTVFAKLGVGVTLISNKENFLPFVENELRESLRQNMANNHVLFVDNDDIEAISIGSGIQGDSVRVSFSSKYTKDGKEFNKKRTLKVDILLYSAGRDMNSDNLGLENVSVEIGKYGRIVVDKTFKTSSKSGSIYAVGDVIGSPMLASSAQAQARRLAEQLFATRSSSSSSSSLSGIEDASNDLDVEVDDFFSTKDNESNDGSSDTLFGDLTGDKVIDAPLTLWSIPEVSSVGVSFESLATSDLTASNVDIFQGYAYFKDCARGRLSGTNDGYLKVVCKRSSKDVHVIVGVHIFGEGANELIQLGALLVHSKTTVQTVSKTPFAAVTLTGLFQSACDDILRQIQVSRKDEGEIQ